SQYGFVRDRRALCMGVAVYLLPPPYPPCPRPPPWSPRYLLSSPFDVSFGPVTRMSTPLSPRFDKDCESESKFLEIRLETCCESVWNWIARAPSCLSIRMC